MIPENPILRRLARRIDMLHRRFEETSDERWLNAAIETDRVYRRAKELLA